MNQSRELARILIVIVITTLLAVSGARPATADATFDVDSTKDFPDANPGDGTCADDTGACTLRAAIMEANALAGEDTILLGPGKYKLKSLGINENASETGDLDILSSISITGAGADHTIIHGVNADRIFDVQSGALTLTNLTLTKGAAPEDGAGGCILVGGAFEIAVIGVTMRACQAREGAALTANNGANVAIVDSLIQLNQGGDRGAVDLFNVTDAAITSSRFEFNTTTDATPAGAALSIESGSAQILNSHFTQNTGLDPESMGAGTFISSATVDITRSRYEGNSSTYGGAIFASESTVTINETVLRDNVAEWGGAAEFDYSTIEVNESLVDGNKATISGGGLYFYNGENGTVSRSTVVGNKAINAGKNATGGGIVIDGAIVLVENSTVTGNKANFAGGIYLYDLTERSRGPMRQDRGTGTRADPEGMLSNVTVAGNKATELGGGVVIDAGSLNVFSSILDGNKAPISPDCFVVSPMLFTDSLMSNTSDCALSSTNAVLNESALLGPLVYLAPGITPVHVPADGSPALNLQAEECFGADQRGMSRPLTNCDVGAVEVIGYELLHNGNFESGLTGWKLTQKMTGDKVAGKAAYTGDKGLLLKGKPGKKTVLSQKIPVPAGLAEDHLLIGSLRLLAGPEIPDMTLNVTVKYTDKTKSVGTLGVPFNPNAEFQPYQTIPVMIEAGKTVKSITLKLTDTSASGKRFVDYIALLWFTGTTLRSSDSVPLPPPAAPDGFRGGN